MEKNLIRLSYVVSRLLNKPDLYDLNNLARPGACGDYAVFLKEKLEKRLLPFIADLSGETLAVVYQNPLKAFTSIERRKQVCQDLANTMLRLVSIVIACLASLQFESPRAREAAGVPHNPGHAAAAPAPYPQRGGGSDVDVIRWLKQYGYVSSTYVPSLTESRYEIRLQDPGQTPSAIPSREDPAFTLLLNRELEDDQQVYKGYITVTGGDPAFPTNSFLRVYIRPPIQISPTVMSTILPIHVVDNVGVTWLCGVLYKNMFLSLASSHKVSYLTDSLIGIFRKTQPEIQIPPDLVEPRRDLQEAEAIFVAARAQKSTRPILSVLVPTLSSLEGYSIGTPGYGQPAPGLGFMGGVGAMPPGLMVPRRPLAYGYGAAAAAGRPGELAAGEYVIPPPAAKAILSTFRKHAGEIGAANNPAQIRATLLAGEVLRNRTIQTRICQDPYWNATNLSSVYPWAALQFLCIDDFRKLGGETTTSTAAIQPVIPVTAEGAGAAPAAAAPRPVGPARPKLSPEWKEFYDGLTKIYDGTNVPILSTAMRGIRGGAPAAAPVPTSISLDDIRFYDIAKTKGCGVPGKSPRARFQEIQNGVKRLQDLYEEHATEVWKLLNSLILLIEDPDTKSELVRLNPKIFSGGTSTRSFIEEKATEARKLLIEYYLSIERTYTNTIRQMRVLE